MAEKRSATEANESARSAASDGCIRRNVRDLRFESSSNDVDAGAGGSPAAISSEHVPTWRELTHQDKPPLRRLAALLFEAADALDDGEEVPGSELRELAIEAVQIADETLPESALRLTKGEARLLLGLLTNPDLRFDDPEYVANLRAKLEAVL